MYSKMTFPNTNTFAMEIRPPAGLVKLHGLDRVVLKQKSSYSKKHPATFVVKAPDGKVVFKAVDKEPFVDRKSKKEGAFDIHLYDSEDREVMTFLRSSSSADSNVVQVTVCGQLTNIVYIMTSSKSEFSLNDAVDPTDTLFTITAPKPKSFECDYIVYTSEAERIGVIKKKWSGLCKEMFTSCDNYEITFPKELHVNLKAALLANSVLIDYLYYS